MAETGVRFVEINHGDWDHHRGPGSFHGVTDDCGYNAIRVRQHFVTLYPKSSQLSPLRHEKLVDHPGGITERLRTDTTPLKLLKPEIAERSLGIAHDEAAAMSESSASPRDQRWAIAQRVNGK